MTAKAHEYSPRVFLRKLQPEVKNQPTHESTLEPTRLVGCEVRRRSRSAFLTPTRHQLPFTPASLSYLTTTKGCRHIVRPLGVRLEDSRKSRGLGLEAAGRKQGVQILDLLEGNQSREDDPEARRQVFRGLFAAEQIASATYLTGA